MINFECTARISASPTEVFNAWLDSSKHAKMTGGGAECSDQAGDNFSAWDGYISGKNLTIVPNSCIKQAWRTTEFKETDDSSLLEIQFEKAGSGCQVTLIHSQIPVGQPDYKQGWKDHYFSPMEKYFGMLS